VSTRVRWISLLAHRRTMGLHEGRHIHQTAARTPGSLPLAQMMHQTRRTGPKSLTTSFSPSVRINLILCTFATAGGCKLYYPLVRKVSSVDGCRPYSVKVRQAFAANKMKWSFWIHTLQLWDLPTISSWLADQRKCTRMEMESTTGVSGPHAKLEAVRQ
jgi:hypothetical protein